MPVPRSYVITRITSKHIRKHLFPFQHGKFFRRLSWRNFNACRLNTVFTLKYHIYIIKAHAEPLCYKEVRTYSCGTGLKRRTAHRIPSWTELKRKEKATDSIYVDLKLIVATLFTLSAPFHCFSSQFCA